MGVKQRIEWIDMLKGFSIMWLIVYHFYVFDWLISPVSVFFFISGLFYSDGKSFQHFIKNKSFALLIPFLFFWILGVVTVSSIQWVSKGIFYDFNRLISFFYLLPADIAQKNPLGVGAIWFLLSLYEIYIFYYLVRLISKNKLWLLAVSFFSLILSAHLQQQYAMGSLFYSIYSLGYVVFFALGNMSREMTLKESTWGGQIIMYTVFALILLSVGLIELNGILAFLQNRIFCLGLILILIIMFKELRFLRHDKLKLIRDFVTFEGRNSLTILGTHMIAMKLVHPVLERIIQDATILYFTKFIIVLLFCNCCILIFNKYIPFLVNHKVQ